MRRAIRVDHRLAVTLWRLATNVDLRTLAHFVWRWQIHLLRDRAGNVCGNN